MQKRLFHTIKMRYEWMMLDFWYGKSMPGILSDGTRMLCESGRVEGHSKLLDLNKKYRYI